MLRINPNECIDPTTSLGDGIAGEQIEPGQAVYQDDRRSGRMMLASNLDEMTCNVHGIAISSAKEGDFVKLVRGRHLFVNNVTPGRFYMLGAEPGEIVRADEMDDLLSMVCVIGYAKLPNLLEVRIWNLNCFLPQPQG